jgi:hypothetical protein
MDIFVMSYACISIILLLLWDRLRSPGLLWVAGFLGGFAAFSKVEGSLYLGIIYLISFILLSKPFTSIKVFTANSLKFITPSLTIFAYVQAFRVINNIHFNKRAKVFFDVNLMENFNNFIGKLFISVFLSGDWNILFLIFMISFFYLSKSKHQKHLKLILLTIGLFTSLLTGLATLTGSSIWLGGIEWYQVLPRLLLHFFPFIPLFIVLAHAPLKGNLISCKS